MGDWVFLGLLATSPLISLLAHVVAVRLVPRWLPAASPIAVAWASAAAGFGLVFGGAWAAWIGRLPEPGSRVWAALYAATSYGGLALAYVHLYLMTETARRIHILCELKTHEGLRWEELERRYDAPRLVEVRLERLEALGQLERRQGRYRLRGRWLWLIAWCINAWARCLGFR